MEKMSEIDLYTEEEVQKKLKKELNFYTIGLAIILILTIINMGVYMTRIKLDEKYIEQLQQTIFYQKAEIESLRDAGF